MNPEWVAWAKEEIIALHENIKKRDAKIAEFERLTSDLIAQAACAREQGARRLAEYLVHQSEYPCSSVDDLMQLWRDGRGK